MTRCETRGMAGDDDEWGFVLNLADGGVEDDPARERKGNPRKRTVLKPERKGRHRGWAGTRKDKVGTGSAAGKAAATRRENGGGGAGGKGGRGASAGRGRMGKQSGGRGAAPADWSPAHADPADASAAAAAKTTTRDTGGREPWRGGKDKTGGRGGRGGNESGGGRGGRGGGKPAGGRGISREVEVASREGDDDADEGEFNAGDWASLMRKAMTPTELESGGGATRGDKQLSAIATSRVFGTDNATWEGLGLPPRLVSRLRDETLHFQNPTRVQRATIPHMLNGRDVLIRAETGSGKTLAYICPLLAVLGAMEPRVQREDGVRALVMVPTRELAAQVLASATEIASKAFHWINCTCVVGGENKQKEKARLRKGVTLLIATPGRLLDHLQSTQALKADLLRWLILDEADRLLDLGFEEDLNAILADINRRTDNARRCTALLSATLTSGTSRLINLAMTDPVVVEIDSEDVEEVPVGGGGTRGDKTTVTTANAANADTANKAADRKTTPRLRMPAQLRHTAVEVPAKARLATLAGLLAGWMRGAVPKVMVFLNSCESVEFHYNVLSWLAGNKVSDSGIPVGSSNTQGGIPAYSVFRLHGVMSQADRRAVYEGFGDAAAGVLLCTDVGARGLDFENVGATVQVDPPSDTDVYVHRVGRAARLGQDGEAVLFLQPREVEYATVLSELGVSFGAASVTAMLDVLEHGLPDDGKNGSEHKNKKVEPRDAKRYERDPHLHPAAVKLQKRLHHEVSTDKTLGTLAKDAFRSHVRAYATFPSHLKHIFHVKRLHLGHVAAAFGLKEAPGLIGKSVTRERLQLAKDKKRKDQVKQKKYQKEKRKRRVEGKTAPRKAARGVIVGA